MECHAHEDTRRKVRWCSISYGLHGAKPCLICAMHAQNSTIGTPTGCSLCTVDSNQSAIHFLERTLSVVMVHTSELLYKPILRLRRGVVCKASANSL